MFLHLNRLSRRWRVTLVLLAAFVALMASGIMSWPDELRGMRPSNRREGFFRYAAQQLNEPSLCAKIPWSVRLPGGFFIAPSYERSECYDFIAARTKNPWLCWRVRRLGAFHVLDEQTSMWSCLQRAIQGWNGGIALSPAELVNSFDELGYTPDTLHLEGITPPIGEIPQAKDLALEVRYQAFDRFLGELSYGTDAAHLAARARFIARVKALPDEN